MVTTKELSKRASANKVSDRQIEKDYVLTWMLIGVSQHEVLKKSLVFKGGTVLKKCYFEDYRFSEDLDFTLINKNLTDRQLIDYFNEAANWVHEETNMDFQVGEPEIHKESGSPKFYIDYVGPLGGNMGSRSIKIDVTRGEILCYEPKQRKLFADYSDMDEFEPSIAAYTLDEVLIEKMAALMGRTEPRDFYDFWYLTEIERMDVEDHCGAFEQKAKRHSHKPEDFEEKVLSKQAGFGRDWQAKLANQIHDLDKYEQVFREAKRHLKIY
ncbi:MAG: nucleotidyl transferase AbiEii/AbiGii toxin family protein [Mucilaginibacter sp.]